MNRVEPFAVFIIWAGSFSYSLFPEGLKPLFAHELYVPGVFVFLVPLEHGQVLIG